MATLKFTVARALLQVDRSFCLFTFQFWAKFSRFLFPLGLRLAQAATKAKEDMERKKQNCCVAIVEAAKKVL